MVSYKSFSVAYAGCLIVPVLSAFFICISIVGCLRNQNQKMRESCICKFISFLKLANILLLSTLAGIIATAASKEIEIFTAQNAANLVNVLSITYGANDNLPHGRGDIASGAIGSIAAQSAVGIYATGGNHTTKALSAINIAINVVLVIGLSLFVDIDNFTLNSDGTDAMSIEMYSYFDLCTLTTISNSAIKGRIFAVVISLLYSSASIIVFFANGGNHAFASDIIIAVSPVVIAVFSFIFYILRDVVPF